MESQQQEASKTNLTKAHETKALNFFKASAEEQKRSIERIVNQLPGLSKDVDPVNGVWKSTTIDSYWPKWLKNPTQEESSQKAVVVRQAKNVEIFQRFSEEQKKTLDKVADRLPDAPKTEEEIPEPQIIEPLKEPDNITPMDEAEIRKLTVRETEGKLAKAELELWSALTGKTSWPSTTT